MRLFLARIAIAGFAITLALNALSYFIAFSFEYLPWLAVPMMIAFSFNVPIIRKYRARGMTWRQLELYQFAPGWARLLYLLTLLYSGGIVLWIVTNYPHHYDQTRYEMVIDAPREMEGRFMTAGLMAFWATTLALQSSALREELSRRSESST